MIVTVDEAKAHLRIEDDDEDVYLESLITRAQAVAEDFCRTAFAMEGFFFPYLRDSCATCLCHPVQAG